ncbi:glycosyltransferase family 2 protein [Hymenobacter sp. BT730]|uniref:glycosyltransferase family 2 protein n=1 Tax=Hymenobacter sp. BT730 TaxID=3063332 RepID=UPI0026E0E0A0|nr:glycosyltransferase [Hymenobacter sp. BT730]
MPGLSVLLPIYNRDVTQLVQALVQQAASWPGPVEILCLDDGSEESTRRLNRVVATWPKVHYLELPHNIGRSAIRNRLAAAARYPWLLLLDNNISPPDKQFLARYATAISEAAVIVGGTVYTERAPANPELRLRWLYGQRREASPAAQRQQQPRAPFILKNVLMQAEVFRQFRLDETLTHYGHEDSKLGWQLREAGITIHHIDNPALHDGLEPASAFLYKTQQAVCNLVYLYYSNGWGRDTGLLRAALMLRRMGLGQVYRAGFLLMSKRIQRALLSAAPKLWHLDALKLYWALQELRRQQRKK